MTAFTWFARDRNVSGLSAVDVDNAVILPWSADPFFAGQTLPWATPEYPTLLILGVGVTIVTSAVAANRRLSLTLGQPSGATTTWLSSGTQAASLTRRWECAPGFALETTLVNNIFREPLPRGCMLLPGLVGGAEGILTVSISTAQAGDTLGAVSIRGALLYP